MDFLKLIMTFSLILCFSFYSISLLLFYALEGSRHLLKDKCKYFLCCEEKYAGN